MQSVQRAPVVTLPCTCSIVQGLVEQRQHCLVTASGMGCGTGEQKKKRAYGPMHLWCGMLARNLVSEQRQGGLCLSLGKTRSLLRQRTAPEVHWSVCMSSCCLRLTRI